MRPTGLFRHQPCELFNAVGAEAVLRRDARTSGFSGEKDPSRVPDQRDSYPGQQVTVFDNRGICQHSGLCTDRLPTVFRTGAEPFVAPSGGRLDEIIRAVRDCPSGALSLALGKEETRPLVDWDAEREAAIEVSQDGPYRVTGAISLTDAAGADVGRAAGSSREHYALCRCGHSKEQALLQRHALVRPGSATRCSAASRRCSSGRADCPR